MIEKTRIYIGTSGYSYTHWKNIFYPPSLASNLWLSFYARHFNSVELNVTFYRLPKKETFASWAKKTPSDFRFVLKGSRFITHIKRLKDPEKPLALFFSTAKSLEKKISAVLWQLPPTFKADPGRLDNFLNSLKAYKKYRFIFEFRHSSWFNENIYTILKKHNACFCFADPSPKENTYPITSDTVYLRFHGEQLYTSNYPLSQLKKWADLSRQWLKKAKFFYAFFNNDSCGYAIKNALKFKELIYAQL